MRYFLELAYKGTQYSGWQIQANAVAVQQKIQEVLSIVLNSDTTITGSGRTDAGVHARQQFAHFDSDTMLNDQYVYKLNALLPRDISIACILPVNAKAHARFDALKRSYEYFIHQAKSPFLQELSYFFHRPLDLDLMNQAAELLVTAECRPAEKRNYACFTKSGHSSHTYDCQIFQARWHVVEKNRLVFKIQANRFLRGMVRAIVGTLLEVGTKRMSVGRFAEIINTQDRMQAGRSVDACGLYLSEVTYPKTIFL